MERTIFHVDMDSFFASCEQQADPRLRGKPIAVSGDPKSRTVVAAASREAKQWGVKSGMTIRDARALCPHIWFVLGDPDKYMDVSRRVMAILRSYTEDVEIFSIDEAFLDVTDAVGKFLPIPLGGGDAEGVVREQRPLVSRVTHENATPSSSPSKMEGEKRIATALALALDIKHRIRAEVGECVTCSIGVASNKRLAKLASDFKKPDGITVVHAGFPPPHSSSLPPHQLVCLTPSALLSSLKLRDLCGIGARIEARLHNIGIWTVSGLAAAPAELLTREFGVYGVELHDMAHGRDTSPVVADDADPKSVGHVATLPRDIHTLDEARPVIAELAEKVAARLRRYGFRGATVHLTVRFGSPPLSERELLATRSPSGKVGEGVQRGFSGTSEQRSIGAPTDDGLVIAREAMQMLETAASRRRGDPAWSPDPDGRGPSFAFGYGRARRGPAPTSDGRVLRCPVRLLGISVSSLTPRNPWQQPIFPKSQRWTAATQALDAVNDRYGDWTLQRAALLHPVRCLRKAAASFRATRHLKDER